MRKQVKLYQTSNRDSVPSDPTRLIAMLTKRKNGLTSKEVKEFFLNGDNKKQVSKIVAESPQTPVGAQFEGFLHTMFVDVFLAQLVNKIYSKY